MRFPADRFFSILTTIDIKYQPNLALVYRFSTRKCLSDIQCRSMVEFNNNGIHHAMHYTNNNEQEPFFNYSLIYKAAITELNQIQYLPPVSINFFQLKKGCCSNYKNRLKYAIVVLATPVCFLCTYLLLQYLWSAQGPCRHLFLL